MTQDEAIDRLRKSKDELEQVGVKHLYLFGSTVPNKARPDFDVDLFLMARDDLASLARYGIRVNALAPGYFAAELNEQFLHTPAGQALVKRVPQRRLRQSGGS